MGRSADEGEGGLDLCLSFSWANSGVVKARLEESVFSFVLRNRRAEFS